MADDSKWSGERLRDLRDKAGLSRRKLSELAGVSERAIVQWERNERDPSWTNVIKLAEALSVDCNAFMQEQKKPGKKKNQGKGEGGGA